MGLKKLFEVLARTIEQEKEIKGVTLEIKGITNRKKLHQTLLFIDNMMVYVGNSKESINKVL